MRSVIVVLIGAMVLAAAYIGSLFGSVNALSRAVRDGDAGAVIARTDVPRLRASLTGQIAEAVLEAQGRRRVLSPMERSVIGGVVVSVVDDVVALALDPAALTAALRSGRLPPDLGLDLPTLPTLTSFDTSRLGESFGRIDLYRINEFSLRLSDSPDPEARAAIRLRFSAFGWKLSGIELPRNLLRRLADNLSRR